MSYKPQRKLYELVFEDYPGLKVIARSASLGGLQKSYGLDINLQEEDESKRLEVFRFFAKRLVSWDLTHPEIDDTEDDVTCSLCGLKEDDPLPPTMTSLMCLELDMVMAIIFGWINTISRVSLPKEMNTSVGGQNIQEEVTKRLEALQNPARLPMPNLSLD